MFFSSNKKKLAEEIAALKQDIFILKGNMSEKKELINIYDTEIKSLKTDLDSLAAEAIKKTEFFVDFKSMNAFSIERIRVEKDTEQFKTVIGYFLRKSPDVKEVREWALYCDLATHNRLADEFKQYMNGVSSNK